jgi:hypothetical protein
MPLTKTLYHPLFEPRTGWLRSMLLFYDTIHTIVPADAGYTPSSRLVTLLKSIPDALIPLQPSEADLRYDWANYHALIDVLREFPKRPAAGSEKFTPARLDWQDDVPRFELRAGVAVHTDKMGDMLAHDLVAMGLAVRTENAKWLKVERRVADLVLSLLAQRMASRHDDVLGTATDSVTSFAVATRSELRVENKQWSAESVLASRILAAEVPARIDRLPLRKYLEIRDSYREKRDIFRLAMQELSRLHLDGSIGNPQLFQKRLDDVVGEFGAALQDLRQRRLRKLVEQWAPLVIGGVVTVAGWLVHKPIVSSAGVAAKFALEVLKTARPKPAAGTYTAQTQAMLVKLGHDLRNKERSWLARALS